MPNDYQKTGHFVVYSHGLATRRDDNGLFTEIAAALPETEAAMFDYYDFDEARQEMTATHLADQAEKLRTAVADIRARYPRAVIDLVAHSQGTVIAALANPEGLRKALLLAPVFAFEPDIVAAALGRQPGARVDFSGESRLPLFGGGEFIVPAWYQTEFSALDLPELYRKLAAKTDTVAIVAAADRILAAPDKDRVDPCLRLLTLPDGHNFRADRGRLSALIRRELLS